jgi:hypothetical protein
VNWGLFLFTALISIITGVLTRRGGLTSLEAWTIVVTRLAMAAVFAALVPEQLNSGFFILVTGRELAQFFEFLIAYTADKVGTRKEAGNWLHLQKSVATGSETTPNLLAKN